MWCIHMPDDNHEIERYQNELSEETNDGDGCAEMWEALSEKRESEKTSLGRRGFLGAVGAAGMTGTASAQPVDQKVEIRKEESEASSQTTASALDTQVAEQVLDILIQPEVRSESAERTDLYLNDKEWGHTVDVSLQYGELSISYSPNGEAMNAGASLESSEVPTGVRHKLSRGIGWPDSVSGTIMTEGSGHPVLFTREATTREIQQVKDLTGETSELAAMVGLVRVTDEPSSGQIDIPGSGVFVAAFEDTTYVLDTSINEVVRETTLKDILGVNEGGFSTLVSTCDSKAGVCAFDVIMAVPHCSLAAVGCSLTGVGALGCFVLLLSLCAPNLTLIGLSGACTYVARNCL